MEKFFETVIERNILKNSIHLLEKLDKSKLRALRSNLRRNEKLRNSVNSGKLSVEKLIVLPFEELADEETKKKREKAKLENLQAALYEKSQYTKEEIDILINKIDDP
tara:strand:- start:279 stop:599 length:321 start_codon:yes stop_codon:yes gene_type:complete